MERLIKFIPAAIQLSLDLFRSVEFAPAQPLPEPVAEQKELAECWERLRLEYFPEMACIAAYRVTWSRRRHRRTLASCNVERKNVSVAPVMRHPSAIGFLEPLLYHEMCHAALGRPKRVRGRRRIHGKDFRALERRHPGIPALDDWIKSGGWHAAVRSWNRRRAR